MKTCDPRTKAAVEAYPEDCRRDKRACRECYDIYDTASFACRQPSTSGQSRAFSRVKSALLAELTVFEFEVAHLEPQT